MELLLRLTRKRWPSIARALERFIGRLLVVGPLVFIATRNGDLDSFIYTLDLATGEQQGALEAGFQVETALPHGDNVYFAGRGGCIALGAQGQVLWRIDSRVTKKDFWQGEEREIVARDAAGREMWSRHQAHLGQAALIALGDLVT